MVLLMVSPQLAAAGAIADSHTQFIKRLDRMMVELAPLSARASRTIKREYRAHLDLLVLNEYAALEDALWTGGLVRLPADAERFNLKPRTEGASPIAEKDLIHQASYLSARPATVGALLEIASRVRSGPLEITSLVRHTDYQDALRSTNANANTSVPMHTMGLAVDIALVNTPLETVYEIRDVLRDMQKAGEILFIGERRQLVFHVVPHPAWLGYFTEAYARAMAGELPPRGLLRPVRGPATASRFADPLVRTEVIAIHPTDHHVREWWAAGGASSDVTVAVSAPGAAPVAATSAVSLVRSQPGLVSRLAAFLGGIFNAARTLF